MEVGLLMFNVPFDILYVISEPTFPASYLTGAKRSRRPITLANTSKIKYNTMTTQKKPKEQLTLIINIHKTKPNETKA